MHSLVEPFEQVPFPTAHLVVNASIEPSDATYQGRPADPSLQAPSPR